MAFSNVITASHHITDMIMRTQGSATWFNDVNAIVEKFH
jgi:hypothetical protein